MSRPTSPSPPGTHLADASHDLRTALTVALARTQLARRHLAAGTDGADPAVQLGAVERELIRAIDRLEAWEAEAAR